MPSTGRYLRRTGRGTTPGLVVSVVVNDQSPDGEEADPRCRARVFHSVNVAWSYHCKSGWSYARTAKFGDTHSFWGWLDGLGREGRRCYVFSPIATDALTLTRFWERVVSHVPVRDGGGRRPAEHGPGPAGGRGVHLLRLVASGRPDVVTYRQGGHGFVWLSGRQFWDYGTRELAELLGRDGDCQTERRGRRPPFRGRGDDAARVWLYAMTLFADWWASLGAGPFPRTVPGGAMQFFRSRMSPPLIVIHKDESPYKLERAACHGGRASCWYYGTVVAPKSKDRRIGVRPDGASDAVLTGPVYRVDVRSMYPSLLRDRDYPVSLVKYSERWDVDDVRSLARRHGVVADVDLDADVPEYPLRRGGRVEYPVGRFRTVLCGRELERALDEDAVRRVWRAAAYRTGRPFTAAAAELCELRQRYRDQRQTKWELLSKQLANALAGKLAQNPRGWQEVPGASHYPAWDVWICRDSDTGTTRRFRCIAGRVYEYKDIGVGQGCLTASFAFLTSYGRDWMRTCRESCPPCSVLSQDTDGLWVTAAGLAALRRSCGVLTYASAGQLELKERSSEAYWLGPRHYLSDRGWVLAGYHSPTPPRAGKITDSYDVNPVRTGCVDAPTEIIHFVRTSDVPAPPPAGWVDPDGWAHPVRLGDGLHPLPPFPPFPPDPPDDPED